MQNTFAGRKRRRCGVCSVCLAKDCQKCSFCRDKPKYGGEGKKEEKLNQTKVPPFYPGTLQVHETAFNTECYKCPRDHFKTLSCNVTKR